MVGVSVPVFSGGRLEQGCGRLFESPLEEFLEAIVCENNFRGVKSILKFIVCPCFVYVRFARFADVGNILTTFATGR